MPNDVLAQRVRARIGHVVSHPHAITVKAHKGVVTLEGPILEHEVERLLETVRSVRGVRRCPASEALNRVFWFGNRWRQAT
jgi:osmotically-inducible protein OsmY